MRSLWCSKLLLVLLISDTAICAGRKLVPEEFVVKPGAVRYWTFSVNGPTNISGRFRASGGNQKDIEVVIAEWGECENWINGNQASVLYQSGRVTNGHINVNIVESGKYCIGFSNRMSIFSSKEVAAAIQIN